MEHDRGAAGGAMTEAKQFDPASPEAPRRRYLAILFSDLSDSTKIAGALEAEDYYELLEHLHVIYHEVIAAHHGAIAQISGDGMLAVFGYPESNEGDGRRAVEAALDLHARVRDLGRDSRWQGVSLRLHSGIHSGLVLFNVGDLVRGRFELPGSTTNIASRLCGLAEPDQILVSEASLGPERHLFQTGARSHLRLKGKDEPVATLAILGRAPISGRYAASVRGGLTPFVGREAELGHLEARIEEVIAKSNRFVAIDGPPGVGKTRLADEALRLAATRNCQVHRGECETGAEPLQPFLQLARSALGASRPVPTKQAAKRLGAALAAIDPSLLAHRAALRRSLSPIRGGARRRGVQEGSGDDTMAALLALFDGLAARGPLILFIDDWQFADDASREMAALLRGLDDRAMLTLVTVRSGSPAERRLGDAEILSLAPFNESETRLAVTRLLPAADPFVVASVRSSSGGNALFIEELCHSIASGEPDAGPHKGSPWLDILIESRFSRLTEAQAGLVRTAAVIGNIVPSWLLELITGCGEKDPLVAGLADEDFIFPGEREGTLRFKHGLTRDVIYDAVGLRERKALHLHIAEALRTSGPEYGEEEPYEALAYHYGAGGDAAATAHYAELAGDKAMAVSALDRAQAHYKAALNALERLPQSDETSLRWGQIAQRFGQVAVNDPSRDQLPIFQRALELAAARHHRVGLARAEYWLGYIYYGLGEPVAAIDHWERALEEALAIEDGRLAIQIRAALGQAYAAACDYEKALVLLDEAIEIKKRHRGDRRPSIGLAYPLSCKAFVLGDMGHFEEAYRHFEEALAAISDTRHEVEESVLNQHSAVCLWHGRFEQAMKLAEAGASVAERVRSHYTHAMSRSLAAFARWSMHRDPNAIEIIVEATAWLDASERGQFTSLNHGWLAEAMVESGRFAEGRRYAARALLRARKRDRLGEAMAWRAMARAAARERWSKPPAYYLSRAMAAGQVRRAPHEIAETRLCEAELALAAGQPAVAAARAAAAGFRALGMILKAERAEAVGRAANR